MKVLGTKGKKLEICILAEKAYLFHQKMFEDWRDGEPVEAWLENGCDVCVRYQSGKFWHYKDLDLPFPTWW